jgi:DNA-binding PadR family transcriptional regulator
MRSQIKAKWIIIATIALGFFGLGAYCKTGNQCNDISRTAASAAQFALITGVAGALLWRSAQYQPHLQKLSTQDAEILRSLSEGEREAAEIIRRLQQAGVAPSASGDIYPPLARLEDLKLVASRWDKQADDLGLRHKYYRITKAGAALLRALLKNRSDVEGV